MDIDLLSTLPQRQISNGLAEALKMSMTFDEPLFEMFEQGEITEQLEQIICRAIELKRDVVEADEKEQGLRKVLNFGHTVGHGIESVEQEKDDPLYHGECVALGMIPMCNTEVRARLIPILEKLKLPVKTEEDPEAVYSAMLHDKKFKSGKVTVVKVNRIGSFEMETIVPEQLRELLKVYQ